MYSSRKGEPICVNFICFNYTATLDNYISIAKKTQTTVGSHKNGAQTINHVINQICHVHGTVNGEMVLGVNDESQIAKPEIFDCENGDLYKSIVIKRPTNESYLENTDSKAFQIISNSHLIYVYGMSVGDTDKLWWDRLCSWLAANTERHLILHTHSMPEKSVVQIEYKVAERTARRNFTKNSSLNANRKIDIESRIHITNENIFGGMAQLADKTFSNAEEQKLPWEELAESVVKVS